MPIALIANAIPLPPTLQIISGKSLDSQEQGPRDQGNEGTRT